MTDTLALKHRPQVWAELVGQEIPVRMLTGMIQANTLKPGYLFRGVTGCGKTSATRLFAKRLLCTSPKGPDPCNSCSSCLQCDRDSNPNFRYIDGTQDRSIDFVKDVVVRTLHAAPIGAPWRVVAIDEIHQYKRDSISPFLTLLERMPKRSIFIGCTTEDVLPEIVNRCVPLTFAKLPSASIVQRVQQLLPGLDKQVLRMLVAESHGSFRQVWSVLDAWQHTGKPLSEAIIRELLGSVSDAERALLWQELADNQIKAISARWKGWTANGAQPMKVADHLIEDLIVMAGVAPESVYWEKPLAVMSGTRLLNQPTAWLPALLGIRGQPYRFSAPVPEEDEVEEVTGTAELLAADTWQRLWHG